MSYKQKSIYKEAKQVPKRSKQDVEPKFYYPPMPPTQSHQYNQQLEMLDEVEDLLLIFENNSPILLGFKYVKSFSTPAKLPPKLKLNNNTYYSCSSKISNKKQSDIHLYDIKELMKFETDVFKQLKMIERRTVPSVFKYNIQPIKFEQKKIGKCTVKNGMKFLRLQNGYYFNLFQRVNQQIPKNLKFPIIDGIEVTYKLNHKQKPIIGDICYSTAKHVNNYLFFGKISIVKGGRGLRFIPFDEKMDNMIIINVNQHIKNILKIDHYSFLMSSKNFEANIEKLSSFHFRGKCLSWIDPFQAPLIQLSNQIYEDNLKSLTYSILFTHQLKIPDHSEEALKVADLVIEMAKSQDEQKKHVDMRNLEVYTVDTNASVNFDDGFSIIEIQENQTNKKGNKFQKLKYAQSVIFQSKIEGNQDIQSEKELEKKIIEQKTFTDNTSPKIKTVENPIQNSSTSPQKKRYQIGIHIADVAEYIKLQQYFDNYILQRGQTLYIRNNTVPMLPYKLAEFFSLNEGIDKLACSLLFEMNQDGNIDYSTIKFLQTKIRVKINYTHDDFNKILWAKQESMMKVLENLFQKRSRLRRKLNLSKNRAADMVENIMNCSIQLFNYLFDANIQRTMKFQSSVEHKLNELLFERKYVNHNLQCDIQKIQQQKLNLLAKIKYLKKKDMQNLLIEDQNQIEQNSPKKETIDTKNRLDQIKQNSGPLDRGNKNMSLSKSNVASLPKLQVKSSKFKNQQIQFDEFSFSRSEFCNNRSAINSLTFLISFFEQCGQQFKYSSLTSIKQSFFRLKNKRSALFISYIERVKIRNYQYFQSYPHVKIPMLIQKPIFQKQKQSKIEWLDCIQSDEDSNTSNQQTSKCRLIQNLVTENVPQRLKQQDKFEKQVFVKQQKQYHKTIKIFETSLLKMDQQIQRLKVEAMNVSQNADQASKLYDFLNKIEFLNDQDCKTKTDINISDISSLIKNLLKIEVSNWNSNKEQQNQISISKLQNCQKFKSITWSNPIRDYSSILAQRLLKKFIHYFQGELNMNKIISGFSNDIGDLISCQKKVVSQNWIKLTSVEKNKKVKNANIEIDKLNMVYEMRQSGQYEIDILIVKQGNMKSTDTYMAFHPVLSEVELTEPDTEKEVFVQRRGEVIIESMFPLVIKVKLLKKQLLND